VRLSAPPAFNFYNLSIAFLPAMWQSGEILEERYTVNGRSSRLLFRNQRVGKQIFAPLWLRRSKAALCI
jgi:hypothetical protein